MAAFVGLGGTIMGRSNPTQRMFLPPTLLREIERINDRETRHKARSLFACYLGYLELRDPRCRTRLAALECALSELGITASSEPANDSGEELMAR